MSGETESSSNTSKDGSAIFTRCEKCNQKVPVELISIHMCNLDFQFGVNPGNHHLFGCSLVAKFGVEQWKSMTEDEKKAYLDKASQLNAEYKQERH
ncbi:unnamed protein product [Arabidopsis thaliana]|uniref:HMG box domain-containing protein n=1 Tax=Arabidopsis thaliana TaxID=3702 RepID=A0A654G3Q9_ARATH|nr:unnamed protein product [Arabidopsis thaliana]